MASIGHRNALQVIREATPGFYLDGENLGEILLPGRYIPENTGPGDYVLVFIHRDSEDRLVATTEIPNARVGEFAYLKVVSANPQIGAFLDWGLAKDLLLPIREQSRRVEVGEWVIVYVFLDEQSGRIVATMRVEAHLDLTAPSYVEEQPVNLLIAGETSLGYKAIVENAHWGLIFRSDIGSALTLGEALTGYVRAVRPDGKIDLSLTLPGYGKVRSLTEEILEAFKKNNGRMNINDASSPEEIRRQFATSKKAFKQALGALYRKRAIRLTKEGIELSEG